MVERQDGSASSLKNALVDMQNEPTPDYGEADCRKGEGCEMKLIRIVTFSVLLSFCYGDNLFAELTRSDIKEEIQHIDKRIDDLKTEVQGIKTEVQGMRSEVTGIRAEIKAESKDIRSEIAGIRTKIEGEGKDIRSDLQGLIKEVRSDLQSFLLWGFGIVFAGIFALIGFVLWDRRTALSPAMSKNEELEERESKVELALKEYAEKEPKLKEILKHVGLM